MLVNGINAVNNSHGYALLSSLRSRCTVYCERSELSEASLHELGIVDSQEIEI